MIWGSILSFLQTIPSLTTYFHTRIHNSLSPNNNKNTLFVIKQNSKIDICVCVRVCGKKILFEERKKNILQMISRWLFWGSQNLTPLLTSSKSIAHCNEVYF